MQVMMTVTQKGQVTIPKKIREKFNINIYDKVNVANAQGFIKVTPAHDILDLAGKFSFPKGKSVLKGRREIEKKYQRV